MQSIVSVTDNKINERIKQLITKNLSYKAIADELQVSVEYVKSQATELGVAYSEIVLSKEECLDIFGRAIKGIPLGAIASYYGVTIEDINSIVKANTPKVPQVYRLDGFKKKLDPFKEEIKKDYKHLTIDELLAKYQPLMYDGKLSYATVQAYVHSLNRGERKPYPRAKSRIEAAKKIEPKRKIHRKQQIAFTLPPEAYAIAKNMSAKQLSNTITKVLIRKA